jgi:hypothetical protein
MRVPDRCGEIEALSFDDAVERVLAELDREIAACETAD